MRLARARLLVAALASAFAIATAFAQSIQTVAGGGTDDGRPATAAGLNLPGGVARDSAGNLYIADTWNNQIRKISASRGIISTVAGNGSQGFSGDGGPAIAAGLYQPAAVVVDGAGNLYIADTTNNRVRKVSAATGTIATVAGNGSQAFSGDGGPATAAAISAPNGVGVDAAGNLYIGDTGNNRIRKVSAATGIITTIAGNGVSGFSGDGGPASAATLGGPRGIAVDAAGNVYVTDFDNLRIRRIDAASITISTVAGNGSRGSSGDGGPAVAASIDACFGVAVDSSGNLFIASTFTSKVRRVAAATGIISTVAGNGSLGFSGDDGTATEAKLFTPHGVEVDGSGNLYIADTNNNRIRLVAANTGVISTIAGNGAVGFVGDGGPAVNAALAFPYGVAVDASNNLYIADRNHHSIRRVDAATGVITTVAGGRLGFSGDGGPATAASLTYPTAVAIDRTGNLFIADTENQRIRKVSAQSGIISTVAGNGSKGFSGDGGAATSGSMAAPSGIAVDSLGNLYIADGIVNNRIRKVDGMTGIITTVAGNGSQGFSGDGGPATAAALFFPHDVAVDIAGNLYIADVSNSRIRKVAAGTGVITTVAGNGSLNGPYGVSVDASGNLYIADTSNHRIRKVSTNGVISTVAGKGSAEYSGDHGPATAAGLDGPRRVAVDSAGNLYIADVNNNRIRAVYACTSVAAPSLQSPSAGAKDVTQAPLLSWARIAGAFRYDVYLSTTTPPALIASDVTATTYAPANLAAGATYYWKVVAKGDSFCAPQSTAGSETRSFTTAAGCGAPGSFDLSQPTNGATGVVSSIQLSWQSASGAATYDLYFGTSDPPPLFAGGTSQTTHDLSGLTPQTMYFWFVTAHASCDGTKTTAAATRSFTTAGTCAPAGAFALSNPIRGASDVPLATTLQWSSSANAAGYDLYLGTSSTPPLYLPDVRTTQVAVSGLTPSQTYSWRVVARTACNPTKNVSTITSTFTTRAECATPNAPSITFVPPGSVGAGQTYTIAWSESTSLDASGFYTIERSTSPSFASILDSQQTFSTSASFLSSTAGTYYHRVYAIAGCDPTRRSSASASRTVNVVTGTANVIFTVQPQAVISGLGDKLEDQIAHFALENLGTSPLQVIVGKGEIDSNPFFTIRDALGGDSVFVTLEPRKPRTFEIRFSGPPNDQARSFQGIVFVASTGQGLAITPYAFVNLKVGGGTTSRPVFVSGGNATEYAFFPGFSGDDGNRPPITVNIRNDGTAPMELGAEIGPEVWLVPESGWNASPIPPGATRPVKLRTKRSQAPNGSALPRYTYFTVRSKNGETARLLVQDGDALPTTSGRTSLLEPGSRSFIIPGAVSAATQFSRLRLTNIGSEAVQTTLFFTPSGADGLDSNSVRRATVVVPPNDVVSLTDPLAQVFGLTPPAQGSVEVRAASEKIGFLIVSSSVITPVASGGSYTYEMPTLLLGEGARLQSAHAIVGVSASANTHTALTLLETTGTEAARVHATLYDNNGVAKGSRDVDVPRYGQIIVDNVITSLGGSEPFDGGRIALEVQSGGGAVAGVVTMIDTTRNTGVAVASQSLAGASAMATSLRRAKGALADVSIAAVAPVVVNGLPAGGAPQRTTMGFSATAGSPLTAIVTYRPRDEGSQPISKTLQLPAGVVLNIENVLEDLFGIAKGQTAHGSIFVQAAAGAQIYARLMSLTGSNWGVASGLPLIPSLSDALSSVASKRPLYLDGLEQSIDTSRGARWNVVVDEVGGASGSFSVRLYEAGNRSAPIAEGRFSVAPYQQLALETVFSALGLDADERQKDRTNVLCMVTPESGSAVISAVGVAIDNRTGDTRHIAFSPTGGIPSTGVLRLTFVAPVPPPPSTGRRRAVHQ